MAEGRFSGKLRRILELVTDRRFYKPMILLLVLVVAIEWSSFPILGFYLVTIFKVLFTSSLANRAQTVAVKIPDASWCIKHLLNSTTSTQYWAPCQYTHKHSLLLFTVQYTVYTLYYGEGKISVCDAFYYAVDDSKYLFSLLSTNDHV